MSRCPIKRDSGHVKKKCVTQKYLRYFYWIVTNCSFTFLQFSHNLNKHTELKCMFKETATDVGERTVLISHCVSQNESRSDPVQTLCLHLSAGSRTQKPRSHSLSGCSLSYQASVRAVHQLHPASLPLLMGFGEWATSLSAATILEWIWEPQKHQPLFFVFACFCHMKCKRWHRLGLLLSNWFCVQSKCLTTLNYT